MARSSAMVGRILIFFFGVLTDRAVISFLSVLTDRAVNSFPGVLADGSQDVPGRSARAVVLHSCSGSVGLGFPFLGVP